MVDFEQLRAERQSLSDKIEGYTKIAKRNPKILYFLCVFISERNNELAKLRLRCNADTQILAHVREKEFMLDNIISMKSAELERCTKEMGEARNDVNRQKSERDTLRKTFNNLSQSCGLLDKPDLLADFDKVQTAIGDRQREIEILRANIAQTKAKTKLAQNEFNLLESKSRSRDRESSVSSDSKLPWIRNGVPIKRLKRTRKI